MATDTAQPRAQQASEAWPARQAQRNTSPFRLSRRETFWLAATLAIAAALRLTLAARGWPYSNSDEANTGLMGIDILWHGAHPAFTYGIHHVGALDAYLQVPFFLVLGPTNFAMHVTTTVLMLLFLFVFHRFTRMIYSPLVAGVTTLLLALGPYQALFYGLRAGHYAQDMLVLGALLLWLTVLRLRRPAHTWADWALDLGIGLVAGLALWGTILMLPFVLAAGLALGIEGAHSWWTRTSKQQAWSLFGQALATVGAAIIGMLPLIASLITTRGALFTEAGQAAEGAAPAGPPGGLLALGQQIAATFLIGLPLMLGSETVCAHCALWPYPGSSPSLFQALPAALTGIVLSLVALTCWVMAASPLARNAWYMLHHPQRARESEHIFVYARYRARTWGRAVLVIGGGLTILLYLSTRSAYEYSDASIRYISSIYLCTPLIAAPLCRGAHRLWRWLSARGRIAAPARLRRGALAGRCAGQPLRELGSRILAPVGRSRAATGFPHSRLRLARPRLGAFLAAGLLVALFVVHLGGAVQALQETANTERYGVPAGARDTQLLSFLETHHATRFYTTWWVCYRLVFDAREHVDCAVVDNSNAFAPGFNPLSVYVKAVAAAPHPAYVFDLTTTEAAKNVPQQVASRIAVGDPHFAGYTSTTLDGYLIFYYAGT